MYSDLTKRELRLPELQGIPMDLRAGVLVACRSQRRVRIRFLIMAVLKYSVIPVGLACFIVMMFMMRRAKPDIGIALFGITFLIVVTAAAAMWVLDRFYMWYLRLELRLFVGREWPNGCPRRCPRCNYDLRGCVTAHCSECGARIPGTSAPDVRGR